jgi:uncharacterized protein (DUF488 family)
MLKSHEIRTIVDVRLRPDQSTFGVYSRSRSPEKGIERLLAERGIAYVSLIELGNLFLEREDWQERYRRLLDRSADLLLEGLDGLAEPICLLCAERAPANCHRSLIAEALVRRGREVAQLE